jgi:hypothetical protein
MLCLQRIYTDLVPRLKCIWDHWPQTVTRLSSNQKMQSLVLHKCIKTYLQGSICFNNLNICFNPMSFSTPRLRNKRQGVWRTVASLLTSSTGPIFTKQSASIRVHTLRQVSWMRNGHRWHPPCFLYVYPSHPPSCRLVRHVCNNNV